MTRKAHFYRRRPVSYVASVRNEKTAWNTLSIYPLMMLGQEENHGGNGKIKRSARCNFSISARISGEKELVSAA